MRKANHRNVCVVAFGRERARAPRSKRVFRSLVGLIFGTEADRDITKPTRRNNPTVNTCQAIRLYAQKFSSRLKAGAAKSHA